MHQRVLHVEVLGIVKHGDGITLSRTGGIFISHDWRTILCDSSHSESVVEGKEMKRKDGGAKDFQGRRNSEFRISHKGKSDLRGDQVSRFILLQAV